MSIVRKMVLAFIAPLLFVLLLATAFDFGVMRIVGSPDSIKQTLAQSGVYNSVVANALEQAQNSAGATNQISLNNADVKQAAQDAFSPQVVRQSTEEVIDGVYDWLNGKTAQPDFNVNLTDNKASFAEKVGQAAQQRAFTLPTCKVAPSSADPLNVTCLPPGVTPAQVGVQAKNAALNVQGFLEHPNITPASIKSSDSGQSVFESGALKDAPERYQKVKKSPTILLILTVLLVLAVIFLSSTLRKGIRRVGVTLVFAGALILLFAWIIDHAVIHTVAAKIQVDNKVLQSSVQKIAVDTLQHIDKNYWDFGALYAALGVIIVLAAGFWRRGNKAAAPAAAAVPQASIAAPPSHYKTPPKPQYHRTPKIQG